MVTDNINNYGKIRFENLNKSFFLPDGSELPVLENISLDLFPGEILALIGPSGCGKTTLMRLVAGLDLPSSGSVEVDGQVVGETGYQRTFMSQEANLFPWYNVKKNIGFGLEARKKRDGISQAFIQEKISSLIEMVGLNGFEDAYPYQLSGGMAQRVALARALANEPTVLLLDEPFGSLDSFTKMAMQDELLEIWRQRPRTIIFVTHDIDEAVYLADGIAIVSPRPGHIKEIIRIPLSKPRDRMDYDFLRIKEKIYEEFRLRLEKPFIVQI